jgi:hypothetical protein
MMVDRSWMLERIKSAHLLSREDRSVAVVPSLHDGKASWHRAMTFAGFDVMGTWAIGSLFGGDDDDDDVAEGS